MPESSSYCQNILQSALVEKLEARAFRYLCQHLQEQSSNVSNMELMTLSGFCRNCLAKWMVLAARDIVDTTDDLSPVIQQGLDGLSYEDAAEHVYGMPYKDWKQQYQTKATDEQMERYNANKPRFAVHDQQKLKPRAPKSNVCCEDVPAPKPKKGARTLPTYIPPPLPNFPTPPRIAVLTVSDRAFHGEYTTGDLSGPAVVQAVTSLCGYPVATTAIVPDDCSVIQGKLKLWVNDHTLILTTGGTGMSPRDVTPEATREILDVELSSLVSFCSHVVAEQQPLSSLSRGTAGVLQGTIVANLPGNPESAGELLPVLLPLLLHALADLEQETKPEVLHIE